MTCSYFNLLQLSWTKSLKNRFKNVPRSARTGLEFTPPSKKKKSTLNHNWTNEESRILDETTYQRHKAALIRDYDSKVSSKADSTSTLMKETAANRREWILKERPTIKTIIKHFPYLKEEHVVSQLSSIILSV